MTKNKVVKPIQDGMTVRELIQLLQAENPDLKVAVSQDSEGNGFHLLGNIALSDEPMRQTRENVYRATDLVYVEDGEKGENCLIIWP
jgi:hypothetical protein